MCDRPPIGGKRYAAKWSTYDNGHLFIVINGSYEEMNGVQKETRHCLCNKSAMFTCNKAKMDEETNKVCNKLLLI
jgi:hypothetical protein